MGWLTNCEDLSFHPNFAHYFGCWMCNCIRRPDWWVGQPSQVGPSFHRISFSAFPPLLPISAGFSSLGTRCHVTCLCCWIWLRPCLRQTVESSQQWIELGWMLRAALTLVARITDICPAMSSNPGTVILFFASRNFAHTSCWMTFSPCWTTAYTAAQTPLMLASPKACRVRWEIGWWYELRAHGGRKSCVKVEFQALQPLRRDSGSRVSESVLLRYSCFPIKDIGGANPSGS